MKAATLILPLKQTPQKFELILFILLVSLSTFSTDLYAPALPVMMKFFSANSTVIQQSLISYMYGFSLCMLVSGIAADYWGRKVVLILGLSLYTLSSLAALFITSPGQLDWVRFFQGLGGCVGTVIIRLMIRERFTPEKSIIIFSYLVAGMSVTFALSPLIGALLLNFFSWHSCFIVMTMVGFFLLIGIFSLSDSYPPLNNNSISLTKVFCYYRLALSNKNFIFHTLAIALSWTGFFIIILEYPVLISKQYGYSNFGLGIILSLMMTGYLLGSLILRKTRVQHFLTVQKTKVGLTIMVSGAILGSSLSVIYTNFLSLLLPSFIYLIGMAIVIPNSQYAALEDPRMMSGVVTSLLYFIEMITTALISSTVKSLFLPDLQVIWLIILVMLLVLFLMLHRFYIKHL
jgi:DHA1 family bicyclomycin/chloramphenicol resistance-like MFS transporter